MHEFDILNNSGWNASVPPNGFINRPKAIENNDNPDGLSTTTLEIEIETTPEHLNLVSGDPNCATWVRTHDDPGVVELREHLRRATPSLFLWRRLCLTTYAACG